jgi:diguanylate cyclase (GGDEF)-like protein
LDKKNKIDALILESKNLALENPKESYKLSYMALTIAEKNNLKSEKGYALFQMAYACRVMSDYSNGLDYAFKALDLFNDKKDFLGILKAKNIIGIIYFYYGDYTEALKNFMTALELVKFNNDPNFESAILNNIGEIHREAKENEKAIKYYKQALKISLENSLELNASAIYLNIGEIYFIQKKYKASLSNLKKAYKLSKDQKSIINQGEVETKLGRAMYIEKKYDLAKEYYISALIKFNKVDNKFYLIELLINLSLLDDAIGISPLKHLKEALEHAIETGLDSKVSLLYKLLAEYHERNQGYKTSLNYFKLYHMKEKEVEASNLSKKLEILSIEFNYYKEKSENLKFKKLSEKLERDVCYSNNELKRIKKKNSSLMKENIIDELTQIYNRRGIKKMFSKILNERVDYLNVVYIIDIDYFKKYNDSWGHLQGDTCLKMISDSLKSLPYKDYFVGRFGGEEFLCFMRVNDMNEAVDIGESIRKSIENLKLAYSGKDDSHYVTVSIGGKIGLINNCNINKVIDEADHELYKAKENGRNQISITDIVDSDFKYSNKLIRCET